MKIFLDKFFPTSITNFKKLIKVVELDLKNLKDRDILLFKLRDYIEKALKIAQAENKRIATLYFEAKQTVAESEEKISSGRQPNGLTLSEDDIKNLKDCLKSEKRAVNLAEKSARRNKRLIDNYKRCLELIKNQKVVK